MSVNLPLLILLDRIPVMFAISASVFGLSLFFVFFLNGQGKTRKARIMFVALSYAVMVFNSIATRGEAHFHLFLLTEVLVIFFIFPSNEGKFMYPAAALVFLTFLIFQFLPSEFLEPLSPARMGINFYEQQLPVSTSVGILEVKGLGTIKSFLLLEASE